MCCIFIIFLQKVGFQIIPREKGYLKWDLKGEPPQCSCAYILTQRHCFLPWIAVMLKHLRHFRRQYGIALVWTLY